MFWQQLTPGTKHTESNSLQDDGPGSHLFCWQRNGLYQVNDGPKSHLGIKRASFTKTGTDRICLQRRLFLLTTSASSLVWNWHVFGTRLDGACQMSSTVERLRQCCRWTFSTTAMMPAIIRVWRWSSAKKASHRPAPQELGHNQLQQPAAPKMPSARCLDRSYPLLTSTLSLESSPAAANTRVQQSESRAADDSAAVAAIIFAWTIPLERRTRNYHVQNGPKSYQPKQKKTCVKN